MSQGHRSGCQKLCVIFSYVPDLLPNSLRRSGLFSESPDSETSGSREYGWRFPGPKIAHFCKNWQFFLFIGSDFLLEIQFLAIFGQYRSIEIDYRQTFFLGRINVQLQIQNRVAGRINFHYRDRSGNISRKSLLTDAGSFLNSSEFPLQIQISGSK